MKAVQYVLFVFLCLGSLVLVNFIDHKVHPTTVTADAVHPDILLGNVVLYTREHAYDRSLNQLSKAIRSMREIEDAIDDEKGKAMIELAIEDLEVVYSEIEQGNLVRADLQHAMMKAFNALTVAELRVSETFLSADKKNDAMIALGYGKVHLKNAIRYGGQEKLADELKIYTELENLPSSDTASSDEILEAIDKVLVELDKI